MAKMPAAKFDDPSSIPGPTFPGKYSLSSVYACAHKGGGGYREERYRETEREEKEEWGCLQSQQEDEEFKVLGLKI